MKIINTKFKGLIIFKKETHLDNNSCNLIKVLHYFYGSGKWDRTTDLRLMSPAL